ncbi:MAG TPA: hypothetical protein VK206_06715 [Anaerolineales bacterium]|nr:hypothetical protein [Anaerolineales bacterium]HLO33345.1 hypothetical protein [Anaerolineales bacterium]
MRYACLIGNVIVLTLFGGFLLWASIYIFRISRIREKYLLKKGEGPVDIVKDSHMVDGRRYEHYELHVDGQTFRVASTLADLILQGDRYAIYYSQGSISNLIDILCVERLSKAG